MLYSLISTGIEFYIFIRREELEKIEEKIDKDNDLSDDIKKGLKLKIEKDREILNKGDTIIKNIELLIKETDQLFYKFQNFIQAEQYDPDTSFGKQEMLKNKQNFDELKK